MYEVTMEIGASASNYWGKITFIDKKGVAHSKEISGERSASKQSNILQALIDSLEILKNPCMLNIYCNEDYLVAAFQNGWLNNWQQHNWKSKKGKTVRNMEQWKQVWELLTPHSRRMMKCQKV